MRTKGDICLICGESKSTKTNSHVIPSFLVAMATSYDDSYKRGKELMFTISPYCKRVYTGALPSTRLEEIFDMNKLSEDRIKEELQVSTVALDYIFCPNCEKALGDFLEAPYSAAIKNGRSISPLISYFFWVSVIWRMSVSDMCGFKLDNKIERNLHDNLDVFLKHIQTGQSIDFSKYNIQFSYRIIHCKNYCKSNAGCLYAKYDNNTLTIMLGDICICVTFNNDSLDKNYSFFGLEDIFITSSLNDGHSEEQISELSIAQYSDCVQKISNELARIQFREDFKLLDEVWLRSQRFGYMPIKMKLKFMQLLYSDDVRLGDKYLSNRYVDIFKYLITHPLEWL